MSKLVVQSFGVSLDGFGGGPNQDLDHPLGVGGRVLLNWYFPTCAFKKMHGLDGGETGIDNDFAERGVKGIGSWILGRNMFGPIRGEWPDDKWKGWWGDNPPYHTQVFVLTHYPRESIEMEGGNVFHFVTDGIHSALDRARKAADGQNVRIGGGIAIIREYLQAGLIDELHLAITPILLGSGENLLAGIDLLKLGYKCSESAATPAALHVVLTK